MKHIFIIDPLEKLVVKKDSSLLLAHTLSKRAEVYISYEDDWFFESHQKNPAMQAYSFESELVDGFHLAKFEQKNTEQIVINEDVVLHFRKDPPFDRTYLHMCWILQEMRAAGATVINDPSELLMLNEKLIAYTDDSSIPTVIARKPEPGLAFAKKMLSEGYTDLILKPLDLYQGIGVIKVKNDENLAPLLEKAVVDYEGVYVLQPFLKAVESGEIRSVFYDGEHIGSIIKIPPQGSYLANIAQGAKYHSIELEKSVYDECQKHSKELSIKGVPFAAFDILDNKISEINITCPGLLVEIANALEKNVCEDICDLIEKKH